MRIKAVLFDLDDTLWPVAPVIMQAELSLHRWMAIHAPKVVQKYSIDELRQQRNALLKTDPRFAYDLWALRLALLRKVFKKVGEDLDKADQAMQVFAEARNQVELYEDVLPVLELLRERLVLGSISNGFADLQAIGLAQHFQVSLAAHSFGCAKPDRRIFSAACAALDLSPQQVAYVGDDLALDVRGAQQAGMQGIWMNRQRLSLADTPHQGVQPDAILANLHELIDFL